LDSESLCHKIGSCQPLGSLLQYRTSPDIESGVKVSIHDLHVFVAAA